MKFFEELEEGIFQKRPNRFIVQCRVKGRTVRAYMPNPGKLRELLLPESKLFLVPRPEGSTNKMEYTVVAVEKGGVPVLLHTHLNNRVARVLIERGLVPGLKGAEIVRPEVTIGKSRFDFLLRKGKKEIVLEVKSCTLFSGRLAMFPDAVTARGRKHLLELGELSRGGMKTAVLFIVHSPAASYFMPEYHTDPEFTKAMIAVKDSVDIRALSVGWNNDLSLKRKVHELTIPWDLVERESGDRGSYMVILQLKKRVNIKIGRLGEITFRKGFYIYAGSAMKGLSKRVARHQRTRKNYFWYIDYLRAEADFIAALPVRSSDDLECEIARSLQEITDWYVPRFGSSDCRCDSHLFGMVDNPLLSEPFVLTVINYRMDRLLQYFS